jgi:protein TonB
MGKESYMRSTRFIALSVLLHVAGVFALVLTPVRSQAPEVSGGDSVEVNIGEPAEQAGIEEAPVAPQAKAATKKSAPKPKVAAAPVRQPKVSPPEETPESEETPVQENAAAEPQEPAKEEKEVLTPVKETVPAGVEAQTEEEEKAEDKSEPAVAAAPAAAPGTSEGPQSGELHKGGATQAGAVSYLELRQMTGNKPPAYPVRARLEKRQGSLELLYRVTKEGKVADVQVVKSSGSQDLDDAAVRAISNYRFVPGQEGWARHPVVFALKGAIDPLPSRLRVKDQQAQTE